MDPTALLPLLRKACWGISRPKNPTASAGCEPANLGTKGQHVTSRPLKSLNPLSKVKIKEKCILVQALRLYTGRTAHRGSRGIALFFHDHGTRRGWGVSVMPRPILWKDSVPIAQEAGGNPRGRSGQVRKISTPPGFDPRTAQPVDGPYTDWATRPI
jgi:hypothetical protein